MADEKILLRRRESGGYDVFEESFIGEIHAAMTYAEGLTIYAMRCERTLVDDEDKSKPIKVGVARDEQEADRLMYQCALDDAQHLSRTTGKPFVNETGRGLSSEDARILEGMIKSFGNLQERRR
jgi:hypothetical protein